MVQKLQDERQLLQERLGSLQHALAQLEAEKREVERSALRLEKERVALKKTLDKVGCSSRPSPHLLWVLAIAGPSCTSLGSGGLRFPLAPGPAASKQHPTLSPFPPGTFLLSGHPAPLLLSLPRWSGRSFAAMRIQCG